MTKELRDPNSCPFCGALGCTEYGCRSCGAGPGRYPIEDLLEDDKEE